MEVCRHAAASFDVVQQLHALLVRYIDRHRALVALENEIVFWQRRVVGGRVLIEFEDGVGAHVVHWAIRPVRVLLHTLLAEVVVAGGRVADELAASAPWRQCFFDQGIARRVQILPRSVLPSAHFILLVGGRLQDRLGRG